MTVAAAGIDSFITFTITFTTSKQTKGQLLLAVLLCHAIVLRVLGAVIGARPYCLLSSQAR